MIAVTDDQNQEVIRRDTPPSIKKDQAYLGSQLLKLGDNIDQINLYARLKDFYKIFEVASIGASSFMGAKSWQTTGKHLPEEIKWEHAANFGRGADLANTALQGTLSYYSAWLDKQAATRTYEKLVREELKLDRPVAFDDLRKSHNPIVRDTAAYYSSKAFQRYWPDAFGLVRFVPLVLGSKILGGKKAYEATKWMELIPGTTLGLGAKSFFFTWYFTSRKTGTNYELIRIWNKTEGVSDKPNRALNQGVNPGELVASEDITALYEAYRSDYNKQDFTVDDPLTGRLFEQVARYLNHNYIPKLYADKRPDLFDTELNPEIGKARIKDLQGTELTHARLIEFLGTGGFDIDAATATAIRLEVMARQGIEPYRIVSRRLASIEQPSEDLAPEDYKAQTLEYLDQLNQIASSALGEAWPPNYVKKRISKGIFDSYYRGQPVDPELQKKVDDVFAKYEMKPGEPSEHVMIEEKLVNKNNAKKHKKSENDIPVPKENFQAEVMKQEGDHQSITVH